MSTEITDLEVLDSMDPVLKKKIAAAELRSAAPQDVAPLSVDVMRSRYETIKRLAEEIMVEGKDYGVIPGTDKPVLLKPGAEKLGAAFGLVTSFDVTGKIEDWERGFFYYDVTCTLCTRDGHVVASASGSCNTKEPRYRYRWEGKGSSRKRVENTEPFDLVNTVQKMAAKRAHVAAIRIATAASDVFGVEEADEPNQTPQPTNEELATAAKQRLVSTLRRAGKLSKDEAVAWAADFWQRANFPVPYEPRQLENLLVDAAVKLTTEKLSTSPSLNANDIELEALVRELAGDAKHVDEFVRELVDHADPAVGS